MPQSPGRLNAPIGTEFITILNTAVDRARPSWSHASCAGEMYSADAVVRVEGRRSLRESRTNTYTVVIAAVVSSSSIVIHGTAAVADEHHYVRPGSDALLLLAVLNVLEADGRFDGAPRKCGLFLPSASAAPSVSRSMRSANWLAASRPRVPRCGTGAWESRRKSSGAFRREALDRALATLEYTVAIDFYINETTRHADLVLPAMAALEGDHLSDARVRNGGPQFRALCESPVARRLQDVIATPDRKVNLAPVSSLRTSRLSRAN